MRVGGVGPWGGGKEGVAPLKGSHLLSPSCSTDFPSSLPPREWALSLASALPVSLNPLCLVPMFPGIMIGRYCWSSIEGASLRGADEDRGHRPRHGAVLCQARARGQCVSQPEPGSDRGKLNEHPRSLWTPNSTGNFHEC